MRTLSVNERSRPTRANVGASPRQKFRKKWEHRADHFGRCIYCRLDVRLYIDDYIHGNLSISSRKKRFTRSRNGSFEFLVSLVEKDTSARETGKERGTFLHVNFHSLDLQLFIRSTFRTLRSPFAEDLSSIKVALQSLHTPTLSRFCP